MYTLRSYKTKIHKYINYLEAWRREEKCNWIEDPIVGDQ